VSKTADDNTDGEEGRAKPLTIFQRIGTFLPAISILGIAVPTLVFVWMMQINGWQVPKLGFGLNLPGTSAVQLIRQDGYYLFESPTSRQYFTQIGGNYDTLLNPWRQYFKERNVSVKELTAAADIGGLNEGVLIVPSALALSDAERDAILGFRTRGGSILATWATGTRSGSGEWSGWQLLDSLGAKVVGEIPKDAESRHLTLDGESPVSHQQPPGTRIWMGKTTETLLRMTGTNRAARFMDWPRIPEPDRKGEAAITFDELPAPAGRSVVYAFAETAWESRPFAPHLLIDDTLRWLSREPIIVKANWPQGKSAAQIIEMDTEQGFENASAFAQQMQSIGYRSTFYVLTSVGVQYPDLLRTLARDFEVGYHGDVHTSFKDLTPTAQEQRLLTMKSEMASVLGDVSKITGFRAPTEGYDKITEQLIHKLGIRHHAADPNRLEGRVPAIVKMDGVPVEDSLVVIPRTQRDDINLYWERLDVPQLTQALIDDFDLAVDSRSLGFLSVHSQNFGPDSVLLQAMPEFLAHLQKRRSGLWLATGTEIADWWRDRERIALSSAPVGRRLDFNITIKGDKPVKGASFTIMLPQKGLIPTVRSTKIGTPLPQVNALDEYRASVVFDQLPPGDYVFQATFTQK